MKPPLPPALAGLTFLAAVSTAHASVTFPGAVQNKLGLAQVAGPPPGCRLCHQTDAGGLKTATQPFGRAVLKAGAAGGSIPSLLAALDSLAADATDSDLDGVSDIDELKAGTDPNAAPEGSMTPAPRQVPLPETGCALKQGVNSTRFGETWALLGLVLLAVARRRR